MDDVDNPWISSISTRIYPPSMDIYPDASRCIHGSPYITVILEFESITIKAINCNHIKFMLIDATYGIYWYTCSVPTSYTPSLSSSETEGVRARGIGSWTLLFRVCCRRAVGRSSGDRDRCFPSFLLSVIITGAWCSCACYSYRTLLHSRYRPGLHRPRVVTRIVECQHRH